MPLTYNIAPMW